MIGVQAPCSELLAWEQLTYFWDLGLPSAFRRIVTLTIKQRTDGRKADVVINPQKCPIRLARSLAWWVVARVADAAPPSVNASPKRIGG